MVDVFVWSSTFNLVNMATSKRKETYLQKRNILKYVKYNQKSKTAADYDHFNNLLSIHQSFSKQYCMILNLSFLLLKFL
jgi:hypothetical protein